MGEPIIGRRRFIVAAVTIAGAALTLTPALLRSGRSWAQAGLDDGSRAALAHAARLLYPHDAIGDDVYAEVLDQAMSMVAREATWAELLGAAESALDAGKEIRFADAEPAVQIAALKAVEQEPFFAAIQFAVGNRLYSHPKIWALLGYEGSSWEKGGYLHRGAGVIDWLPEAEP